MDALWFHSDDDSFNGFDLNEVVGYRKSGAHGSSTEYLILLRGGHELTLRDKTAALKIVELLKERNGASA